MKIPETVKGVARLLLPAGPRPRRVRGGALRGRRLWLDLRVDTQAWRGIYEVALQQWLQRHVLPGSVFIDVGAAEGHFTLLAALLAGPGGRVIAFEPSPRRLDIRRNLDLNGDAPLARIDEVAAYAAGADAAAVATDGTPQISVDNYFAEKRIDRCDVVKIDVDGGEIDVLHGMHQTLQRYHPHLAIEVHSPELRDGVVAFLEPLGYTLQEVEAPPHEHRPIPFNPTLFSTDIPAQANLIE